MRHSLRVLYVLLLLVAAATTAKAQQQNVCQPLLDGATPAFCEDFATPDLSGLGRGGQLNHANWTYNYMEQDFNLSQSHSFLFPLFTLEGCNQLIPNSGPGNDSVVCSDTSGGPHYWHHGFDDSGSAAVVAARSLRLFDFSQGTETLTFNAIATTSGSHTNWIGLFIGDQPVPNPQPSDWPVAGAASLPRNGLYFALDDTNCVTAGAGTGRFAGDTNRGGSGVGNLTVINNYQEIGIDTPRDCIQVQGSHLNNFQVKLSKTHIKISGADAPTGDDEGINERGPNFHTLVDTDINLNFDKGYVYLEMGAYNAGKEFDLYGSTDVHNTAWSSVGWTGPVHPAQRAYSAPNANFFPGDGGEVAAGWFLDDPNSPKKFTLTGVDLTNAQAAWLTFSTECASVGGPLQIMYQVNNSPQHIFIDPKNNQCWADNSSIVPVPLSDLKNGTNTITLGAVNFSFGLVNVDLLVDPQDTGNPPPPATVSVSISPTTARIQTGASQQFTATVTGSTNAAVTWTASGGSVSIGGLFTAPSSTGAFTITATSVADATKSASATVTVTAPPPPPTPTAPVISGLATSNISATSAEISWATDQTASDQVQYGTTTAYGSSSRLNTTLGTSHMVVLNGLTAGTRYHFVATSTNAAGLSTTTADGTFTTAAPPPPPAAVVLVGDNVVEASADTTAPGVAAAFKYTSGQAGTASHLHVYLDASNTAQNVVVAIYTHNGHTNSPGRLLAQGTVTNVVNGDWNTVSIPSVNLNANATYWISVLQPARGTGQLVFRDHTVKGGSDQPSQPNLTAFPATWTPPVIHGAPASVFASN
jgi:hypothetical protein